jgi:hypothetical protein
VAAVDTAAASSTSPTVEDVVPFVIVGLAVLFAGWRIGVRRRRGRDAARGPAPTPDHDPGESDE